MPALNAVKPNLTTGKPKQKGPGVGCNGDLRLSPGRDEALRPRMIGGRCGGLPNPLALIGHGQEAIEAFRYEDSCGPSPLVHLKAPTRGAHGPGMAQGAFGLQAEEARQVPSGWSWPLSSAAKTAPPVGLLTRCYAPRRDQPILQGLQHALDPPLVRGGRMPPRHAHTDASPWRDSGYGMCRARETRIGPPSRRSCWTRSIAGSGPSSAAHRAHARPESLVELAHQDTGSPAGFQPPHAAIPPSASPPRTAACAADPHPLRPSAIRGNVSSLRWIPSRP